MNKHNHVTRDIKPLGQCPACDDYHDRHIPKRSTLEKYKAKLEKWKKAREIATQGEYSIERVDFEHDEITYEVKAYSKVEDRNMFHVVFRESECADVGVSAKQQAIFYALSANHWTELIDAHIKAIEALEKVSAYNKNDGCAPSDNKGPESMSYWRWQEMISRNIAHETLSQITGGKK